MKQSLLTSLIAILAILPAACQPQSFQDARQEMVANQIKARGITDEDILKAFRTVARHHFVPDHLKNQAYRDSPLPIGHEATISQPYIVAYMTQLLEPTPSDRMLEVGTGSGYQAAILATLVDSVYTIEIVPELAKTARARLKRLGYTNVVVKQADGYRGWKAHAPYDGIVVTAAADEVPPPLVEQLARDGRMILPVETEYGMQRLILVTKDENGTVSRRELTAVRFVPLIHKEK